jgi:hypothetical protein
VGIFVRCIDPIRQFNAHEGNMMQWIQSQDAAFWWLLGSSVAFFVLTLVGAPVFAVQIPPDYFAKGKRPQPSWKKLPPVLRPIIKVGKNLLGALLVIAGVAMLVLPGQGVFAILAGIMLLDFPGKRRLVQRIVSQPAVLTSINRLRKRYGRPPLVVDG